MMSTLLRHIAESSLFALIVWGIASTLKNQAAVRNRLWIAAIFKFVVPFSYFDALGASVGEHVPGALLRLPALYTAKPENVAWQASHVQATSPLWTVCVICWTAISTILVLTWLRRSTVGMRETVAVGHEEEAALVRCADHMQFEKLPRIWVTSQLLGPYVRGTLHPVIVVPRGLYERLGEKVFESVIMHELAHIKRKDNLWAVGVHAVVCAFPWYLPLWWMERRVRREAELACDALVLEAGAPREAYVSGLVEVCRMSLLEPVTGSSFTSEVNLKHRLEWIMSNHIEGKSSRLLSQLGGALLAGGCTLAFVLGAVSSKQSMAQLRTESTTTKTTVSGCEIGQSQPLAVSTIVRHVSSKVLQVCVSQDGKPLWLTLAANGVPAGLKVVDVFDRPQPSALSCRETAPHGELCTCDNLDFSPGSVVNSTRGKLACPASGGRWQPYKSKDKPWPPVSLL